MADNPAENATQFQTAVFAQSAPDTCKGCKQPVTGVYYRANGAMLCGSCAELVKRQRPADNHAAFVRAVLFGLAGFGIGLTFYAAFAIITGITIGYISLAVGWIIGKAMMIGSKGIGGRRYQVTAVLLTYAAVSMAFIPIAISVLRTQKTETALATRPLTPETTTSSASASPVQKSDSEPAASERKPKIGFAKAVGTLAMLGLASPFLELQEGFNGVIGLVILFVGMQFAWKMTAGKREINVEGPYELSAATSA